MKKLLILIGILILIYNSYAQEHKDSSVVCTSCKIVANLDSSLKLLKDSVKSIMSEDVFGKGCVFKLIDTLTTLYIKTSNKGYIVALDSITCRSDGAIAEAIDDKAMDMFCYNFKPFVDYLFQNRDTNNCLVMFVEWGIAEGAGDGFIPYNSENIQEFIIKQEKQYGFSKKEMAFLDAIVKASQWYAEHDK